MVSSPLTSKTAQFAGVAYEPASQPNRLPEDLMKAKADFDRQKDQRKTLGVSESVVSPKPVRRRARVVAPASLAHSH